MSEWTYDAQQQIGRLIIEGGLTVAQAGQVRGLLLQGFATAERVECDLSRVIEADIAGLQLLCAARRYADAHGKTLVLAGSSARLTGMARQTGFSRGLGGIDEADR